MSDCIRAELQRQLNSIQRELSDANRDRNIQRDRLRRIDAGIRSLSATTDHAARSTTMLKNLDIQDVRQWNGVTRRRAVDSYTNSVIAVDRFMRGLNNTGDQLQQERARIVHQIGQLDRRIANLERTERSIRAELASLGG